jgi:hydantoinase/carbamoylase family amidase
MLQRVSEEELREEFRAIDDGRSFWEHAREAGYEPELWRESIHVLDDLSGWIEMHIEQARVLQDTGKRIGIVTAIAGYVHGDVRIQGRGDHAGATPMDIRLDPTVPMAETIVELERLARAAGKGTVGTVGEIEVDPGIINAIAAGVRFSLDIRGPDDDAFQGVARTIAAFAEKAAAERGMSAEFRRRQTLAATPLDARIVDALTQAAEATGEPYMRMHSGAAHDTMCVAERVPSAMVFVPCRDGISHHPDEDADPADAALAAEIILNAIRSLA